ncbi:M20/M25/M40 family metallo-hydrolase [Duganella sp. CT11-25]|uniref:M20/M25/M40 family metallo-hydrolase n=1 Tax=unclassified Duganella TaxID=2636909 RepID=UPI0039AFB9C1
MVLGLLGAALLGLRSASVAASQHAEDAPGAFSAGRALESLRVIARESHPTGTKANADVRAYLLEALKARGVDAEVQEGVGVYVSQYKNSAGHAANIVARLPGRNAGKAVMVVAHYDSAQNSYGAADDGAAVAAMLETIRALKSGPPLANNLIFLFTDAEESGLLGADAFAAQAWVKDQVALVLNFDFRGNSGPLLMFETHGRNGGLIDGLGQVPQPRGNSLMAEIYRRMPNDTDLSVFKRLGLPGMNFAAIEHATDYHTELDNIARLDQATLAHTGETMLALVRHFGEQPLATIGQQGERVYFTLPAVGLVSYPVLLNWPLAIGALVLLAALVRRDVRAGQVGARKVLASLLGGTLGLAALYFLCQSLWGGVLKLYPGYGRLLLGETYNSPWYVAGFALLGLLMAYLIHLLAKRWLNPREQFLGAAALWCLLLLLATVLVPGAAFLFAWPLLAMLLFATLRADAGQQRGGVFARLALFLLAALPAMLIVVPVIHQVAVALTLRQIGVVMLVEGLLLLLLVPMLGLFSGKRVLPLSLAAAVVFCFVAAGTRAAFDASHPAPNALALVQGPQQYSWWLSTDDELDGWTSQFIGKDRVRRELPEVFGARSWEYWTAPGPALALAVPIAEVERDELTPAGRQVRLRLKSPDLSPKLVVEVDGATVLRARFGGRLVSDQANERWRLEAYGMPADGALLELTMAPSAAMQLRLIDVRYGLPLQPRQRRPAGMIAQPFVGSDTLQVVRLLNLSPAPAAALSSLP